MRLNNPLPLFMLMVLFSPLAIDIFLPAVPDMALALEVPVAWVQQTLPMFMLAFGVGQLVVGPLADRFGRRPMALTGTLLYLAASSLAANADQYSILMAARVGQGLAASCLSVAAYAGVRDFFGAKRCGAMFSYLNGVICIVPAAAPLLGGLLTSLWGWESNFWFMAGYALLMFGALSALLPETRPSSTDSKGRLFSWRRYRAVLSVPVFIFYAVLALLGMAMILGYVTQTPTRLMVDMGLSKTDFALWFAANAVVNIVCAFVAPRFIEKIGQKAALWFSVNVMAIAAVAEYLLAGVMQPIAFMGPVFLASVGFAVGVAVASGSALAPFGDRAGTASALFGLFQMSGAAIVVGLLASSQLLPVEQLSLMMVLPWVWVVVNRALRGVCISSQTDAAS